MWYSDLPGIYDDFKPCASANMVRNTSIFCSSTGRGNVKCNHPTAGTENSSSNLPSAQLFCQYNLLSSPFQPVYYPPYNTCLIPLFSTLTSNIMWQHIKGFPNILVQKLAIIIPRLKLVLCVMFCHGFLYHLPNVPSEARINIDPGIMTLGVIKLISFPP